MPLDPFAAAAEALITSLLTGPGTLPTIITAASYSAVAAQLHASAASVEGSMTQMGESWRADSSDIAQAAFRSHSSWLHKQGEVAAQTSAQLLRAAEAYVTAQQGMAAMQTWLAEFEVQQALLAAGGPSTLPVMLVTETESMAILGATVGVLGKYEGDLGVALAAIPEPTPAPTIVSGQGGGGPVETQALFSGLGAGNSLTSGAQSLAGNVANTVGNQAGSTASTAANSVTDAGQAAAQPVTDAAQAASTMSDPLAGPAPDSSGGGGADGSGTGGGGYSQQQGAFGPAPYSPTLSGLNGGVGSAVVLGMARGGLGTISGSATGFRMPANWSARGARAFGAADAEAEAEAQPVADRAAPKGASAPETQMKRRAREKTKSGKVIVPGDDQEVPALEQAPAVGVLEYAADDLDAEPIAEQSLSVGVLERVDEETLPAELERSR
ncbi:PPE domain-containing protein [Nocardia alni]|uniref:PPE domain-containing protein n=1 Tax=Nocardia alni TaxID=2815723 RepID=UPI001C215DF9|nr:PPE domain-containing protein [Nocardia alni]